MFSSQSNALFIFLQDFYLNCSYPVSLVTYAIFPKHVFAAFLISVGEIMYVQKQVGKMQ